MTASVVTRDGTRVFLYAGTREHAERAREVVDAESRGNAWKLEAELTHWHPEAEAWAAAYDERPPNPFALLGGLGA